MTQQQGPTAAPQIATLDNTPNVMHVHYTPRYAVVSCRVGEQPFSGWIEIEFKPNPAHIDGRLLEFESFETWLKRLCLTPQTIEELCRAVFKGLSEALGDVPLKVTVCAETVVHAPASATIERG